MRRITTILAVAAACAAVPAAASAAPPAWAGEKPGNYGSCVAYEAMAEGTPVSGFHETHSPAVSLGTNGEKMLGPNVSDETAMACVINFGRG